MKGFLLDVNLLIALLWARHEHHLAAQEWFAGAARRGWATCAFTQVAFVRIVANPAFSKDAVRPAHALGTLRDSLEHASHRFWGDRWGFTSLVEPFVGGLRGHRQVSDAYLLALARRHGGRLATFDAGIGALLPREGHARLLERVPVNEPG